VDLGFGQHSRVGEGECRSQRVGYVRCRHHW
jgi:hypothetical protein